MAHPLSNPRIVTRDQARAVDRYAIEEIGTPGLVLMENAGLNAAAAVVDLLQQARLIEEGKPRVAVLCGGGNNGGDGYVIARQLHNRGVAVTVFAAKDPAALDGDAAVNHRICVRLGIEVREVLDEAQIEREAGAWDAADVLVDALLGTGFHGEVRSPMDQAIRRVNALRKPVVVAVDVPSGFDCETGTPTNATIQADQTVTFVADKTAFHTDAASGCTGRVIVADIGLPDHVIEAAIGAADVAASGPHASS